jgi:hypothetical protein
VKGEDVSAFWRWVELVRELRLDAGRFISERQWLAPFRIDIQQTLRVLARLFFDADKGVTFWFRLDGAERLPVTEQQIISFASFSNPSRIAIPRPAERLIVLRF